MMDIPDIKNGWQALVVIMPWVLSFFTALVGTYFAYLANQNALAARHQSEAASIGSQSAAAASKAQAEHTAGEIQTLRIAVDGRLTKLLATTESLALAQGIAQGIETERTRPAQTKPPAGEPTGGIVASDVTTQL